MKKILLLMVVLGTISATAECKVVTIFPEDVRKPMYQIIVCD